MFIQNLNFLVIKEWKQEVQNKIMQQFDVQKWENPNPLTRGSQEVQTKITEQFKNKRNTQKSGYLTVSKNKKQDVQILKIEKLKKL